MHSASQGDLTSRASTNRTGAFSDLNTNANSAAERLSDMIFEIQSAAGAVNRLVADIKANMIDMSDQAKSQSSALAVIAEKVATIAGVVSENASSASEAEALTGSVTTLSASSIETVEKAISAVADIERIRNVARHVQRQGAPAAAGPARPGAIELSWHHLRDERAQTYLLRSARDSSRIPSSKPPANRAPGVAPALIHERRAEEGQTAA